MIYKLTLLLDKMTSADYIYQLRVDPAKINGKNILITGGTGSFGKKMIKTLLENFHPRRIIIYSRDEYKQALMKEQFNPKDHPCLRYFIGDVRDYDRMLPAFRGVDLVFHTSALKRVQECEYNPMEAVKTNIIGTENVIKASIANDVPYVIGLSTDKACSPVNHYGATKLCAEKLLINGNITSGGKTKCAVVRYGNQLNSRGSLVEIFNRLKSQGKELTVTDLGMTRFTILLQEAVNFVLLCYHQMIGGEIFIPRLPSYSVEQMVRVYDCLDNYRMIGIRAGEKTHEYMISGDESHQVYEFEDYFVLAPSDEILTYRVEQSPVRCLKKREANHPYSSGDNYLITDQRLESLVQSESTRS